MVFCPVFVRFVRFLSGFSLSRPVFVRIGRLGKFASAFADSAWYALPINSVFLTTTTCGRPVRLAIGAFTAPRGQISNAVVPLLPRSSPKNWRTHPQRQVAALQGALREIGYADALLAREFPDGSLELIDGHARRSLDPDQVVPVLVTDLDEVDPGVANLRQRSVSGNHKGR